jgi:hypothetical protein
LICFFYSQPIWTIIDSIQQESEIRAIKFLNEIQQKDLAKSRNISALRQNQNISLSQLQDQLQELKVLLLFLIALEDLMASYIFMTLQASKSETSEILDENVKDSPSYQYEYLVKFIQNHIEIMLRKLYVKITKEEKDILATNLQSSGLREKGWYKKVYTDGGNDIRIVGPLGGRPLHVCALAIDRFGPRDFRGEGNFVATGIIEGILAFVNHLSSFVKTETAFVDKDKMLAYFQNEVTSQYGKDYCAAVGHYLVTNGDDEPKEHEKRPPYWDNIVTWQQIHLDKRGLVNPPKRFAKMLVCTGLFEGETILFPLIAGNYREAIDKLVEWQKNLNPLTPDGRRTSGNSTMSEKNFRR